MVADSNLNVDNGSLDHLSSRLKDPRTASAVTDILAMAPELAGAARILIGFVQRSSQIAENVNGIVDTARQSAMGPDGRPGGGIAQVVEIKDKLTRAMTLLDRLEPLLADPKTLASLESLLKSLPKLTAMLHIFELFLGRSSEMAENVSGVVDTFRQAINKRWPTSAEREKIASIPGQVMDTIESPALHRLLSSFVLSEGGIDVLERLLQSPVLGGPALEVVGRLADAVVEADTRLKGTDARVGPLGVIRAMNEPDVQKGIARAIEIARIFGRDSNSLAQTK
ncbi:MAG: DUF1641 domain-containing protein [Planctomycetota bacterium]|nr:DUF1641 domain-containing protein [Planctomycetota bacterium]